MRNVMHEILTAWFRLLDGNISVPVYRLDAPPEEQGDYVVLRPESETDQTNNHKFVTSPVIISEVVTRHAVRINDAKAYEIDNEIAQLLQPTPATHSLSIEGLCITDVRRQNANYLPEDDGTHRYFRLITRNLHRVQQN